mmetsp:Transcript_33968/g.70632  ORF Transcript_33968/g.70632 Transcript_33968/m.70632 type:complete len:261 (-) Transcript_33968:35-817(-)
MMTMMNSTTFALLSLVMAMMLWTTAAVEKGNNTFVEFATLESAVLEMYRNVMSLSQQEIANTWAGYFGNNTLEFATLESAALEIYRNVMDMPHQEIDYTWVGYFAFFSTIYLVAHFRYWSIEDAKSAQERQAIDDLYLPQIEKHEALAQKCRKDRKELQAMLRKLDRNQARKAARKQAREEEAMMEYQRQQEQAREQARRRAAQKSPVYTTSYHKQKATPPPSQARSTSVAARKQEQARKRVLARRLAEQAHKARRQQRA